MVIKLINKLGEFVKKGQIICEMSNEKYIYGVNKWIVGFKFKYELKFGKALYYKCGIKSSKEIEEWSPKIHFIDDWSYFESEFKKIGWMSIFSYFKTYRNAQITARYQIG